MTASPEGPTGLAPDIDPASVPDIAVPKEPLTARERRFQAAVLASPRRRVTLVELWRILDEADPGLRMSGTRRHDLLAIVTTLSVRGTFRLPAPASWDRTETPHLPRFVELPATDKPAAPTTTPVWHPALAWVPDSRPNAAQRRYLEAVNRWLHTNRSDLVVPVRERSLEVFGHEKTLDRLVRTNLFGPGRLSLDLLKTRRAAPRFTHDLVGTGSTLLVVENSDTFDSLARVLRDLPGSVGAVAWGAGGGFEASVLSLSRLPLRVDRVLYFGDLDLRGLEIPASASRTAAAAGLPTVHPAVGLYETLLNVGQGQAVPKVSEANATRAAQWLPEQLRDRTVRLLTNGLRLAQEDVGLAKLTNSQAWREGLE